MLRSLVGSEMCIRDSHGVEDRVHFIYGGKLAKLLDHAKTAVTINSTAGQQALWRSIPLKTFGSSIYGKPEFVSDAPLSEFFADPDQPDSEAYILFREFCFAHHNCPAGFILLQEGDSSCGH